jgi:hypothetical protein
VGLVDFSEDEVGFVETHLSQVAADFSAVVGDMSQDLHDPVEFADEIFGLRIGGGEIFILDEWQQEVIAAGFEIGNAFLLCLYGGVPFFPEGRRHKGALDATADMHGDFADGIVESGGIQSQVAFGAFFDGSEKSDEYLFCLTFKSVYYHSDLSIVWQ